jgi:hypothetical protein
VTFTVVHPVTGDRAEAGDLPSAVRAAEVLRADALDAGTCTSTRVSCLIFVGGESIGEFEPGGPLGAGCREQGGSDATQ